MGFDWWYAGRGGRTPEEQERFYLDDMRSRVSLMFYVFTGVVILDLVIGTGRWVLSLFK